MGMIWGHGSQFEREREISLSAKDAKSEEDVGINPQTRNKGVLLAYQAIRELEGYNLSNIFRKRSRFGYLLRM